MITCSIDYLSGVGVFPTRDNAEEFIDDLCKSLVIPDEYWIEDEKTRIGKSYEKTVRSNYKIFGGLKTLETSETELAIQLPGTFCRGLINQQESLKEFANCIKPTRIDLALDDDKRRISQEAVHIIGSRGDYVGVDSYMFISSKGSQEQDKIGTCKFGSSNKAIRFYNAEAVHGIKADRWELVTRYDYAKHAITELLEADSQEFANQAGKIVLGSIDFVKRSERYDDRPRYKFWQSLRDEIGTIELSAPKQEYSISKLLNWYETQINPSLGIFYKGLGRQEFLNWIETQALRGIEKHKQNHQALIQNLKQREYSKKVNN